jgi:hypothetical protein
MARDAMRANTHSKRTRTSRPPATARKPKRPATIFLSQTEAKDRFLSHCRHAIDTEEYVCVKDQTGEAFLTLTTHRVKGPAVTVSAQFFKDNFARCCSLIRDGVVFQLKLRSSNQVVYARRHTSYKDPLDDVIGEWQESIVAEAINDADQSAITQLARDFAAFASHHSAQRDEDREEASDRYKALVRGIARMAIGHLPFEEGRTRNQRDPDPRATAH